MYIWILNHVSAARPNRANFLLRLSCPSPITPCPHSWHWTSHTDIWRSRQVLWCQRNVLFQEAPWESYLFLHTILFVIILIIYYNYNPHIRHLWRSMFFVYFDYCRWWDLLVNYNWLKPTWVPPGLRTETQFSWL